MGLCVHILVYFVVSITLGSLARGQGQRVGGGKGQGQVQFRGWFFIVLVTLRNILRIIIKIIDI